MPMSPHGIATTLWHTLVHVFALVGLTFTFVFFGMQLELFTVRGSIAERNAFFTASALDSVASSTCNSPCPLFDSPEWRTIEAGFKKDADIIKRVSFETGIPPHVLASVVAPEQLRFFTSEREVFKQVFEPLKVLGVMSEFSLGISGIKQDAARDIERRAPAALKELLHYPDYIRNTDVELFSRLTDPDDHYYQYLYTAIYIRIIEDEWNAAGFPIHEQPGVIATLFNLGFTKSKPHARPQLGGAEITIQGKTYTYGELAQIVSQSPELTRALATEN